MNFLRPTIFATVVFLFAGLLMSNTANGQLKHELNGVRWGDKLMLNRLASLGGSDGVIGFEKVENKNTEELTVRCFIIKSDTQIRGMIGMELTINKTQNRVIKISQTSKDMTETEILWSAIESYDSSEIIQTEIASTH